VINSVAIIGVFDNLRSRDIRLLEEAGKFGSLTVLLYTDEWVREQTRAAPKFPLAERVYFVRALRFVSNVIPLSEPVVPDTLPSSLAFSPDIWVDSEFGVNESRREFCRLHGLEYRVLSAEQLLGFPEQPAVRGVASRKKVVVTGCYDWLHSGHVRFFEEVSQYGDLYVIVGHDANIRLLKGPRHPLLPQAERRYMAGAIRFVTQALISSGDGWLDAEPEIEKIKPDIYAVNEDGDKRGKREYCDRMGIEYLVLRRIPAPGLLARSSTSLRGF
jgi:cytidyltransferase-like protein